MPAALLSMAASATLIGLAAVTQAISRPAPRLAHRWIITRSIDLAFVIGSASAGYAYLLLYVALHVPISFLWWFWSVGFDGTHIFGTASRTFFDSEARRSRRALLYGSAAFFFALGPAMVLLGGKALLAMIVAVWAYYHVVRQHYGFMVLYKVKNRDLAKRDNFLDRWFLGVMMVFPPFHRFFIHHPEELRSPISFPRVEPFLWVLVASTVLVYLGRQMVRWRAGDPVNLPKFLLFAGVVPYVLGSEYARTTEVLRWLSPLPVLKSIHYFLSDTLTGAGHQGLRSAIQTGVAIFNVLINFWLIPSYSWRGAAWSSIASDALLALSVGTAVFILSRRSQRLVLSQP